MSQLKGVAVGAGYFSQFHFDAWSQMDDIDLVAVAEEVGLTSGAAFPVLVGDDVVAVLEFFSSERKAPDEAISEVMMAVGTQLGRIV